MISKLIKVVINGSIINLDVEINELSEIKSIRFSCGFTIKNISPHLEERIMDQIHWIWK